MWRNFFNIEEQGERMNMQKGIICFLFLRIYNSRNLLIINKVLLGR